MIRTFVISGIKIKIKYRKIDTYSIDILKFRDINNLEYQVRLAQEEFDLIRNNFPCCIKSVHEDFHRIKSVLSKIIRSSDRCDVFEGFYVKINELIYNVETDLEVFEKDAFNEIEKYASKEGNEREIFELILLRKKLLIQLFNFVSVLYKSKRLLKRICDAECKYENKDLRSMRKGQKSAPKLEYANSINKARNMNDSSFLKLNVETMQRHSSANEGSS